MSVGAFRRRLAERLKDESGFTLVELLSAQVIGGFVLASAISMIFIAMGSATRVTDRVNSAAQGRVAMEEIQQRLRSQTCLYQSEYKLNSATQATTSSISFLHASPSKIAFFSDLGNTNGNTAATSAVGFSPQITYLYWDQGPTTGVGAFRKGKFIDGTKEPTTASTSIPYAFNISPFGHLGALATGIASVPPDNLRAFADGVTREVSGTTTLPIFTFYDAAGVQITATDVAPISAANLATIDRVEVNYSIMGLSGKDDNGPTALSKDDRTAAFSNDIYLKTLQTACE